MLQHLNSHLCYFCLFLNIRIFLHLPHDSPVVNIYEFSPWRHTFEMYGFYLYQPNIRTLACFHTLAPPLLPSFLLKMSLVEWVTPSRYHGRHRTFIVNNTVSASRNLDFPLYFKRNNIPLSGHVLSAIFGQWIFHDYLLHQVIWKLMFLAKFHILRKCKIKPSLKGNFQKQIIWFSTITVYKYFPSQKQIGFLDSFSWFWILPGFLIHVQ